MVPWTTLNNWNTNLNSGLIGTSGGIVNVRLKRIKGWHIQRCLNDPAKKETLIKGLAATHSTGGNRCGLVVAINNSINEVDIGFDEGTMA
ncbi:hypothetical protein HPP92_025043 [Vanilla planifolia]|uniref:Uncharacterized protein n=1 Tax=Vanilla planifolia TaxID=51239 RepID=A0A835PIB9_VANPL|nr:hypothetical protein HPP92_025043 [Vanilla planifolia]